MGVKRFGDWDKAKEKLAANPGARLALALRQATIKNALLLVREIKRGIRSQAPGGKPFVKLAESILADRAFVGLLRGTVNKDGDDLVNIGAVMEYGATIQHPGGAVIVIPPRPFLHPTMEKHRRQIIENYRQAIRTVL